MLGEASRIQIPDFAGVALVDILANGVATLIIIIAISISARFEQENAVLDQISETATILSREFSEKLVINKLSGNAPARLHDYNNSPIDKFLDPRVMPIFELHRDAVRDYFSGHVYKRAELLQQQTRLDDRLKSMSPLQHQRLRVDIYDVQQFYVFMSILRAYNIRPRHWHFLAGGGLGVRQLHRCPAGTAAKDCSGWLGGDAATQLDGAGGPEGQDEPLDDLLASLTDKDAERRGGGSGSDASEVDAADTSQGTGDSFGNGNLAAALEGENTADGLSQYAGPMPGGADMSGFSAGPSRQDYEGAASRPHESTSQGAPIQSDSEAWHSEVLRGMGRPTEIYQQDGAPRPPRVRMRLASPDVARQSQPNRSSNNAPQESLTRNAPAIQDLHQVLASLLGYCRDVQTQFDAGKSPWLLLSEFKDRLSERLRHTNPLSPEEEALINPLVEEFNAYWPDEVPPLLRAQRSDKLSGLALSVPTNVGIVEADLVGDTWQEFPSNLPAERRIQLNFNLHPSLHQGVSQELERHGVLLVPPEREQPDIFKWRAAVYITPAFDDFVLGFVYAAFSEDGQILIHPESNAVTVNGRSLLTRYPPTGLTTHGWVRLLYTVLIVVLLLLLWPAYNLWFKTRYVARNSRSQSAMSG